MHAQTFHFIS